MKLVRFVLLAGLLSACLPGLASPVVLISNPDDAARTSWVHRAMARAGLDHDTVAPTDLGTQAADGCRLAILAPTPEPQPAAVTWLTALVARGGKVIAFAPLPAELMGPLGISQVGLPTTAEGDSLGPAELPRGRVTALPSLWRQRSWQYQPVTVANDLKVLGWWHGPAAQPRLPAVVLSTTGAFIAAGPTGDDRPAEAQMLLALATTCFADLWHTCLPGILDQADNVGDVTSLARLSQRLTEAPLPAGQLAEARTALVGAETKLRWARASYEEGRRLSTLPTTTLSATQRYLPAAQAAWEAQALAERAYCLSQPPEPAEFRGAWIQDAGGIKGWGWQKTIAALAQNGVTNVFVNVANGGYANYPSLVLPQVRAEGDDPLAEALRWCRQYGVRCHAWLMTGYMRPLTPPAWRDQLEREGRLQGEPGGKVLGWLSPADEGNRRMMAAVARELASHYALDGIQLDYMRFAGPEAGVSNAERRAFETTTGRQMERWPQEVIERGPMRAVWEEWRADQVDQLTHAMSDAARAARPGLQVSAAVWPIWVDAFHQVAQQPAKWAEAGWVDFLCPMNYHTIDDTFLRYFGLQQKAVGDKIPLYPGIAAWRHESPADTAAQIRVIRENGGQGWVLFHLGRKLAEEWLPLLRLGVSAP